jgi:hypothetical protein
MQSGEFGLQVRLPSSVLPASFAGILGERGLTLLIDSFRYLICVRPPGAAWTDRESATAAALPGFWGDPMCRLCANIFQYIKDTRGPIQWG